MWLRHCVGNRLVEETKFAFYKLKEWIKPNGVTYKCLTKNFVM